MKSDPLAFLVNKDFVLDKKFYFISGNETTLIEKIKNLITVKFKENKKSNIKNIETVDGLVEQTGLFDNETLFIGKNCKGIDEKGLNRLKNFNGIFLFIQENSQKTKKIKNIFLKDKDSYLVDCYLLLAQTL